MAPAWHTGPRRSVFSLTSHSRSDSQALLGIRKHYQQPLHTQANDGARSPRSHSGALEQCVSPECNTNRPPGARGPAAAPRDRQGRRRGGTRSCSTCASPTSGPRPLRVRDAAPLSAPAGRLPKEALDATAALPAARWHPVHPAGRAWAGDDVAARRHLVAVNWGRRRR